MKETNKAKIAPKFIASWSFQTDRTHAWAYWEKAFTPEECKKIIDYAEQFEKGEASISNQREINSEVRESKVVWITPDPEIIWVYQKLTDVIIRLNEDYFGFDLFGLIEGLQFTEYNAPSGHYERHVDSVFEGPVRKLSVTIQLSDPKEYEGGELQLHRSSTPDVMKKEQGTVLAFPSDTLHEVTPVTEGKRYSLVGWITGKPFK
jgi:PKHD-type hydroxylase